MTTEEDLYRALKSYCVELGWIEFDETTKHNGEIAADSEIIDWKVLDYKKESVIRFLRNIFPDADRSLVLKVINDSLKHTNYITLKDIVKSPNPAKFSHAIAGVLYYKIDVDGKVVMFPIDMNKKEDVGTATFEAEYKPLTLMRYIRKAIDKDSLIIFPNKVHEI